jgi:hypothetical protein
MWWFTREVEKKEYTLSKKLKNSTASETALQVWHSTKLSS